MVIGVHSVMHIESAWPTVVYVGGIMCRCIVLKTIVNCHYLEVPHVALPHGESIMASAVADFLCVCSSL
jgi:hypothetical protein